MFELNATIANDTVELGKIGISRVLLLKDSNYPWVMLVPEVANLTELHQLEESQLQDVMNSVSFVSKKMKDFYNADKMNIANIGNIVSQLHIHVVARFEGDKAWPGPIWGHSPWELYSPEKLEETKLQLQELLNLK